MIFYTTCSDGNKNKYSTVFLLNVLPVFYYLLSVWRLKINIITLAARMPGERWRSLTNIVCVKY